MSKKDLIESISDELNYQAKVEVLEHFSEEILADYLRELIRTEITQPPECCLN